MSNFSRSDALGVSRRNAGFWYVAAAISIIVLGANTPIPLFTVYQSQWHFSTGMLTVVYAVYTLGVLAAVFLMGPLSDTVGRRRVLLPAIATMIVGLLVCIIATNVYELIIGRVLQGIAVGTGVTTAVAAMGELHPDAPAHGQVALVAAVGTVVGLAGGPLVAGLLAQYGPWPTLLSYLVSLTLCIAVFAGVLATPETVRIAGPLRLRPRAIVIPAAIRPAFVLATYVEMTAYAVAGTFAGLGASFTRDLLHLQSHAAAGLLVALLFVASTAAQVLLQRLSLRTSMISGLTVLALGLALLMVALSMHSVTLFYITTVILGAGHGLSYVGSQEVVDRIAPPDARASVFAGFQFGLYVGATAPSLLVGFAAGAVGFETATFAFVLTVFILSLIGLLWCVRARLPT